MKKLLNIFAVAIFALYAFNVYAQVDKGEENKKFLENVWTLELSLNSKLLGTMYPSILCTLIDFDPFVAFKESIEKQSSNIKNNKIGLDIGIQYSWDLGIFSKIKGSDVLLIDNKLSNKKLSMSTMKFSKHWLVTRSVIENGEQIIWAVPLDPQKGKKEKLILNDSNRVAYSKLTKIFKEVIK